MKKKKPNIYKRYLLNKKKSVSRAQIKKTLGHTKNYGDY